MAAEFLMTQARASAETGYKDPVLKQF